VAWDAVALICFVIAPAAAAAVLVALVALTSSLVGGCPQMLFFVRNGQLLHRRLFSVRGSVRVWVKVMFRDRVRVRDGNSVISTLFPVRADERQHYP